MEVAKYVKLMGAQVVAVKRTPPPNDHEYPVDKFYARDELEDFLKSCDYFCNVLPHTSETIDLLSGWSLFFKLSLFKHTNF